MVLNCVILDTIHMEMPFQLETVCKTHAPPAIVFSLIN